MVTLSVGSTRFEFGTGVEVEGEENETSEVDVCSSGNGVMGLPTGWCRHLVSPRGGKLQHGTLVAVRPPLSPQVVRGADVGAVDSSSMKVLVASMDVSLEELVDILRKM